MLTFFAVHAQRGREARGAIGLLARFRGILVRDHWSAYAGYDCTHTYTEAEKEKGFRSCDPKPLFYGAGNRIRTYDPLITNQ